MDHNLEESLNLDSAMDTMDFDHSGVVVNQADITLETRSHEGDIPMEFDEQQMLVDTGNEEIIVTDFMGEQFSLQEYSEQDDQTVELDEMSVITSQSETMLDLQLDPESIAQSVIQDVSSQPKFITIKAAPPRTSNKKSESATLPRQVAIAPKPPKLVQSTQNFTTGKQYSIAPKPVALLVNKGYKKVPLSGLQQTKGNTVLAQVGKQVFMVPASGGQKVKLLPTSLGTVNVRPNSDQAQLIPTKAIGDSQASKPVMAKVIVQGQSNMDMSNQPAVITKLLPASNAAAGQTRYVMQQKTIPISIGGNKMLVTSPTKQGVKFATKQQIIAIKSPTQKTMPATSQANTTKKVVITANPNQNVILKSTAPPKTAQVSKDGNVTIQGQRTQLHQISVPGKGIQYIRLVTNPTPTSGKTSVAKSGSRDVTAPTKSFVLTDTIGNVIQVTAQKMISGQPPPLVLTGNVGSGAKVPANPERKLVRIAPVTSKPAQSVAQSVRSSQSLLAPLSPMKTTLTVESISRAIEARSDSTEEPSETQEVGGVVEEERESKAAVRALIADAVAHQERDEETGVYEVEVAYERRQSPVNEEDTNSLDNHDANNEQHPLIVIPSHYRQNQTKSSDNANHNEAIYSDEDSRPSLSEDSKRMSMNVEAEVVPYQSPTTGQGLLDGSDLVTDLVTDLGMRPRKACNCTKSQCLKLYCDCFANGEFCNSCNCNNCHNNLENEELRQKAIRACLDRNPNAFRPKIGKAKIGGPEIIRRHNKGCNCKRSGCLKNYCECYEAKIACTAMCKCVGCRNVEDSIERRRDLRLREKLADTAFRPPPAGQPKQPCSLMTAEVIEAVCQCLIAAAVEGEPGDRDGDRDCDRDRDRDGDVIEEFARCLQEIIGASHHASPLLLHEEHA